MFTNGDIVWATAEWHTPPSEHPWLIIDVRNEGEFYGSFPMSSKYYSRRRAFLMEASHADFKETGLSLSTYVYNESIVDLYPEEIRKKIGRLEGDLAQSVWQDSGF